MIFNLVGLKARQTRSSIRTKVLLRAMLLDTTAHQDVLIKQALSLKKRLFSEIHALPLTIHVRIAVLNKTLGSSFRRRYPAFQAENDNYVVPLAA